MFALGAMMAVAAIDVHLSDERRDASPSRSRPEVDRYSDPVPERTSRPAEGMSFGEVVGVVVASEIAAGIASSISNGSFTGE